MTVTLVTQALLPHLQITVSQTAWSRLLWHLFASHYSIHKYRCTGLHGFILLLYIQKRCIPSGRECGFWSQTIWGNQGSRDRHLPRSHVISDTRVSTKRIWTWARVTPVSILSGTIVCPMFLFILLVHKRVKYFL